MSDSHKSLFKPIFLFLAVLLISTVIKIIAVKGNNFPFTMDQGRDMTDIRQMLVTRNPRLVGPTTSINGVLLGPFWYYFNVLPFAVTHGNPAAIVYWQILWFQLSCVFLYAVLRKKSPSLALFASSLLLLSPFGFNTGRYFWNANSMPIFTILFFTTFIWSLNTKKRYTHFLLGLVAGLSMQIEAAFGVLFYPFVFLYFLLSKRKFRDVISSALGFFITLVPQILFEFRHGFIMSKIFLAEFTGKGDMLGEKITFAEKLTQRGEHLIDIIRHTNHLPENLVFVFTALALIVILYQFLSKKINQSSREVILLSLAFILFTVIFYLVFPQKLKIWYTLGFSVPVIFIDALFLESIFRSRKLFIKSLSVIFLIATLFFAVKAQRDYFQIMYTLSANNPSNFQNEVAAADWIYQKANGQGFKVYSYLPSIYDYPYQQLFWWYGTREYGYQPADTSYLPNQPEYIKDGALAWKNKKETGENDLTFLIIEPESEIPQRLQSWLGHFSNLCVQDQKTFPWHTEVRQLVKCL